MKTDNQEILKNKKPKDGESRPFERLVMLAPYYQDDFVTIYNNDCLLVMPALRPVDYVVTDPPYGIGAYENGTMGGGVLARQSKFEKTDWDGERMHRVYIEMLKFISRHQIIFGGNYYGELGEAKCYLVWDKDNGDNYFADCELAWTSFDKAVRKIKYKWQGMLQENMAEKEDKFHPTQKPLGLMTKIVEDYTNASDLILDPFMGSGTTLVAAASLGRKAIGIEINKKYCDIAIKRLQGVQLKLMAQV